MKIIKEFINNLTVGKALTFNQLIIKPIFVSTDYKLPFLTLEEALQGEVLEITEIHEGGSVPELLVKNKGTLDVIVLEGEELRGAKQNRIVNTTIIIPAGSEILLPVSCVEQGRWRHNSSRFSSGENVISPSLRSFSHGSVTRSLRQHKSYDSDQAGIWGGIREKFKRMSEVSETDAMSDLLDTSITPEAQKTLMEEIQYQEKQIGFLAYIGGGFAGGDVFGSTELCEKQMRKLIRGYYLDALDIGINFPDIKAEEILAQIAAASHEQFEAIGKGTEMRFETERIQGAWKLVDESVSHLTVFPGDNKKPIGFEPIISSESKVLILGTMPGEESLRLQQYYAHPQNQFWNIMDHLFGGILAVEYEDRIKILKEKGVALWDLLRECERDGSLDANINQSTVVTNNSESLLGEYPKLRVIFFNGKPAERIFQRHVAPMLAGKERFKLIQLPSSSSANTHQTLLEKAKDWGIIQHYLVNPQC